MITVSVRALKIAAVIAIVNIVYILSGCAGTVEGDLPEIYRTTARYPANYLIDRQGRLQPAPSTERPFEELVAKVDALLTAPAPE